MPTKPGLYCLLSNPKIKCRVLGEGWARMGATVKFKAVIYLECADNSLHSRHAAEFRRLFRMVDEPAHSKD